MKVQNCTHYQKLTVQISSEEREQAKKLAKNKGMTYAGWLGQLVKKELTAEKATKKQEASYGNEDS